MPSFELPKSNFWWLSKPISLCVIIYALNESEALARDVSPFPISKTHGVKRIETY